MSRNIHLTLTEDEFGQLFDGLCVRQSAWQQTAMLMRGEEPDDMSLCEECNGVEEAEALESTYSKLVAKLQEQHRRQVDKD